MNWGRRAWLQSGMAATFFSFRSPSAVSWRYGRRSAGNSAAWRFGSSTQCELICGVSELVNQVSKMSVSAEKPPGCSRSAAV